MTDLVNKECNILSVKGYKQHWKNEKYSYMHVPRPDNGIMMPEKGKIEFVFGGDKLLAKEGDIIFLPENSNYEARFYSERGEVIIDYLINFKTDRVFSECTQPTLILSNAFSAIGEFKEFIERIGDVERNDFKSKGLFYLILNSVFESGIEKSKADRIAEEARSLLCNKENYSIGEIARRCYVSESGLRKIFKDSFGISPSQYRICEKLGRARKMLESTDLPLDEISEELGFFDTAYFCKMFRRYAGISPGKYAKSKK